MLKTFAAISTLFCLAQIHAQSESPVQLNAQKLSPGTALFLKAPHDHFLFPRFNGRMHAFIQVSDPEMPFSPEIHEVTKAGKIKTVYFDEKHIGLLLSDDNVEYIDLAWRLNSPKSLNDTSRGLSKVNLVQNGLNHGLPDNYLGTGVIAGIVDIGFQPDNPNFYNMNGSAYRVKRWWQQSLKTGVKPSGFQYGSEFTLQNDILNTRDDDGTHGTHVAGITAGSGYTTLNNRYRGIAPDADLVFVTLRYSDDTLGGSALGDYVVANPAIIDAFDYIYKYAATQNKPAVTNLSWGMHTGPHDGTSLFDQASKALTGKGKIFCGSAGNDAGNQVHVSGNLQNDTLYTFAVDRNRANEKHESVYIDAWGSPNSTLSIFVTLFDTLGNEILRTGLYSSNGSAVYKRPFVNGSDTLWLTVSVNPKFINNDKPEILAFLETSNASKLRIRLGFTGAGQFHAWNSGQVYKWTSGSFLSSVKGNNKTGKYLNGSQQYSIVENGGTGEATITSGSYIARKEWTDVDTIYRAQNWLKVGEISGFSSRGPLPDGRMKPDIASPGQNIVSSVNYRTFAGWMRENTLEATMFNSNTQYWTLASGTSMASPHTAGVVALLLQQNPDLNPDQIRSLLKNSATRDSFTGPDSNVNYGYGKINAYEAMKKAISLNIQQHNRKDKLVVFPNPVTDNFEIISKKGIITDFNYEIYNISGMRCQVGNSKGKSISAAQLSPGIYTLRVVEGEKTKSVRFIKL